MLKRIFCSLKKCGLSMSVLATAVQAEVVIEDFAAGAVSLNWQIVNDSVMGGISTSGLNRVSDEFVRFSGRLSLANNGGFASVRASGRIPDLSKTNAIIIRVKGDGRRYQLRVRAGDGGRGPDYSADFQTRLGEWQTHYLPVADFVPGWRGRQLKRGPAIEPKQIRSIGILLGDKTPGSFSLDIDWIKAGAMPTSDPAPDRI